MMIASLLSQQGHRLLIVLRWAFHPRVTEDLTFKGEALRGGLVEVREFDRDNLSTFSATHTRLKDRVLLLLFLWLWRILWYLVNELSLRCLRTSLFVSSKRLLALFLTVYSFFDKVDGF
jgi:hypothetical protein